MQKFKNYWLDQREKKKKGSKHWKRFELYTSAHWLKWQEDVAKYLEAYASPKPQEAVMEETNFGRSAKELRLTIDDLYEPCQVAFLAYEDRDPEILEIRGNGS